MKLVKAAGAVLLLSLGLTAAAHAVEFDGPHGPKFCPPPIPAVPEADTWAMMAVGLGLVGLRLRRKNKSDAAA
ncbi:PEP-CTERM sorting domain-containing protein [Sulfuriferula nivalis]|uniref:Ice-binding protein C-terminal domain-containing protein n=1 Tax=Sulfuriferula nivalis TaxID=2675298 RepID=A0A809RD08_9PROT|nr:PEP-CTERM sorting domain-containing protein [Sulfuriferula nivalis]BBO99535.1 hypothetical protein SFSGTM_02440 [Sulfuriferula nivalis]